jgi:protein TonB
MKKILVVFMLLIGGTVFAQNGVKAEGNTLTTREIAPVWPGCEGSEASKKACFKQKLVEHLKENYKFPRDANGKIIRGKAVVSFNIDEEGKVDILKVEGPKKELNEEAKRIILAIPQMKPGERAGKPVPIRYTVPFTF